MKGVKKAAALAVSAAALTIGGAWYAYRTAFQADPKRIAPVRSIPEGEAYAPHRELTLRNIDDLLSRPYETVTITSRDGLRLSGKYYAGNPGAPLMLFFHGYRSTAARDGSGGFQLCLRRGFSVLMADQRGHGDSEGGTITFGIRERYDCLDWANAAVEKFGPETKILLLGVSMGAATVLMASDLPLPPQVKGIIADCGYDSPEDILRETMRRWHYPQFPTWQLTRLGAKLFGHLDVRECSALESMKHAHVPVLLIHGEADNVVPCEMAAALRDACASHAELLTVPGAGHGMSCYTDPAAYEKALDDFCKEVL